MLSIVEGAQAGSLGCGLEEHMKDLLLSAGAACLAALCTLAPTPAHAGLVSFDLTCIMNGLNSQACTNAGSFGTIQLTDDGLSPGEVKLTVDLAGTGQKFRDLMLNLGPGFTDVFSTDGQVTLDYNSFTIPPYGGAFDVGGTGNKGWEGTDGYMTILTADPALTLGLDAFLNGDTNSKLFAALHIQSTGPGTCRGFDDGTTNCLPGLLGDGSLKIGAPFVETDIDPVPEPGSIALVGLGIGLLIVVRRRKSIKEQSA